MTPKTLICRSFMLTEISLINWVLCLRPLHFLWSMPLGFLSIHRATLPHQIEPHIWTTSLCRRNKQKYHWSSVFLKFQETRVSSQTPPCWRSTLLDFRCKPKRTERSLVHYHLQSVLQAAFRSSNLGAKHVSLWGSLCYVWTTGIGTVAPSALCGVETIN